MHITNVPMQPVTEYAVVIITFWYSYTLHHH